MDTSILKRIPVEVRLMIYDYAFVEATIRVTVQTFCDEGYLNETTTVGLTYSNDARLLLSCRAIKCEAEEVLWKTAKYWSRETRPRWASIPPGFVYRIMGPTNLHELANGMSPHVAKHVKHMEGVTIPPSYALPRGKEVMPHLSKFPSLQVLVVKNLLENSFRFGRMSIIILFDGEWITYEKWKARSSAWRYYKGFTRFKIRFDTSTYYPITGLQLVPPKIQDPREFLADRFGMKLGQPDDRALMDTHFITKWAYKDSVRTCFSPDGDSLI